MRKIKLLLILGMALSLALMLGAVPAFAETDQVTVSVDAPAEVDPGSDFVAYVDITTVDNLAAYDFNVTYDPAILQLTDVSNGQLDGKTLTIGWNEPSPGTIVVSIYPPLYPGVSGEGYLADLEFHVIGTGCQTSPIALSDGILYDENVSEIPATWVDASVHVQVPAEKMLVSGLMEIMETSDVDAMPPYPEGFVPCDLFVPCNDVYVWGCGFMPDMEYMIYIEPYVEGVAVAEGQTLDPAGGAPLGYTPIPVMAAADGTIGPVKLFHAEEEHICMYWEIVADMVQGSEPGVYNASEDGLDAVALDEYGFHVVPEALTIILLGGGLTGLGSYVAVRRRKNASRSA